VISRASVMPHHPAAKVAQVGFHIALGPVQSTTQLDRLWEPAVG